ncbi:hypothetical protein cgR_6043 [Corynebacterium glutamicum R]|uniref:Uncharacterized protein n=1 Tax=Corynebacterium glutamicum (strain R) TaxID=340322 RepID=A0AB72VF14_CORGB|nr:hypothetical protein cgR_6043 [Corynebacterium glutamicum R]
MSILFSAHAEVFPSCHDRRDHEHPLLRTRGGISTDSSQLHNLISSSPHTRRYFRAESIAKAEEKLFSAHAEVFPAYRERSLALQALLRTRGGISLNSVGIHQRGTSSPHTRRYFRQSAHHLPHRPLFSAHAEVFPMISPLVCHALSLLRTRGGISVTSLHPVSP